MAKPICGKHQSNSVWCNCRTTKNYQLMQSAVSKRAPRAHIYVHVCVRSHTQVKPKQLWYMPKYTPASSVCVYVCCYLIPLTQQGLAIIYSNDILAISSAVWLTDCRRPQNYRTQPGSWEGISLHHLLYYLLMLPNATHKVKKQFARGGKGHALCMGCRNGQRESNWLFNMRVCGIKHFLTRKKVKRRQLFTRDRALLSGSAVWLKTPVW
jgi:hypothetical protein